MHEGMKRHLRAAMVRLPGFETFRRDIQHSLQRWLQRPFDPDFAILRVLPERPHDLLLDVGTNNGLAVGAMRLYRPQAAIICFEPNHTLAERVRRRFAFDPGVTVHAYGLDAEGGSRTLFVPRYREYVFTSLASIDRSEAAGWLNERTLAGFQARHLTIETALCEFRSLDELQLAPSFIKLDVQGAEERVVTGARETISRSRPVIMMENSSTVYRCLDRLADLRYGLWSFRRGRWSNEVAYAMNVFFVPQELEGSLQRNP